MRGFPVTWWQASMPSSQRTACYTTTFHTRNIVLWEGNRSPAIIEFEEANIRVPGTSDENGRRIIHGGLDMHYFLNLVDLDWHYKKPSVFQHYVQCPMNTWRLCLRLFVRWRSREWQTRICWGRERSCFILASKTHNTPVVASEY